MTSRSLAAAVLALAAAAGAPPQRGKSDSVAYAIVDISSGEVVDSRQLERLRQPAPPGSLLKIAALVTAFATGTASADTRVACPGAATVGGQAIRCSHPRLRHPLRPAEALAVSCNVWFATIGHRLPRARLDGVLTAMGLPPTPPDAPMALAAPGLRARHSPPMAWVEAFGRVLRAPPAVPLTAAARAVLVEGLRGAALYGTAGAFSERALDVAAKTGSATLGGGAVGMVVAGWPAANPQRAIVLLAAGVAGRDAAAIAADIVSARGASAAAPPPPPAPDRAPAIGAAGPRSTAQDVDPRQVRVGTARAGGGYSIRPMPLDDYVAQVLAGEAEARSAAAALEALALAVRTYALGNRGRHAAAGFDLCSTTHCQVLRPSTAGTRRAAASTTGRVLLYRGAIADVYYTASCGGRTERPSAVWRGGADPAYLPSARDRACDGEPRWAAEIAVQDLERALSAAGFRGGLRHLSVDDRTSSGRAARVRLDGMRPDAISGQDLRMVVGRALGWHLLKSAMFAARRTGGGYRFDGNGFGHGVGLCVRGSARRAARGDSAREIVAAYFPGVEIGVLPAGGEPAPRPEPPPRLPAAPSTAGPATGPAPGALDVRVPPSAAPDRAALTDFARRALGQIAAATGQAAPQQVVIVFHPSAESYRRQTGEPWWTSARTRGSRIDLLPVPVLRMRGTLESTLRHELAHVLTAPALQGRPEWVKEGVAMHFAGEPPPASLVGPGGVVGRVRCPSDAAVRQPVSASAARQAYGLAAACVSRALAEGRAWSDLR